MELEEEFDAEEEKEEKVIDVDSIRLKALEHRRIILNGGIDESVIEAVWMQMELLVFEDRSAPIELILNCTGGSTYELGFLIDYIGQSETPIATFGTGQCQSAGFILLASGHYRSAFQKTTLMIHAMNLSGDMEMSMPDMKSYMKRTDTEEKVFYGVLAEQSKFSYDEIVKKLDENVDWYMTAEEALSYGFIDNVIRPKYNRSNRNPFFKELNNAT